MFDIFGNFNSCEEINEKAESLINESKKEDLYILANENGIDKELVDMYLEGEISNICDIETAAIGKVEIEAADLKVAEIMSDWVEYIKATCSKNEKMARAVRSNKKNLKDCIAKLLVWSFKNAREVDKDILKLANITYKCTLGIPGMGTAKEIIKKYYMEG